MNKGFQFVDCGLDNIFLQDGYSIVDTGYGPASVIRDPEDLHHAIAAYVLGLRDLCGKEGRYLRSWLGLNDQELALEIDLTDNKVADWSRLPDHKIPAKSAARLRTLCMKRLPDNFKPVQQSATGEADFSHHSGEWQLLNPK
jgi:hypothetical protein